MRVSAIVVAAGASRRMGAAGPKALLDSGDGRSFLARICDTAGEAGADEIVIVLAPPHEVRIAQASPSSARCVTNRDPARGMLSSILVGLEAIAAESQAALVWPVDHPLVRVDTVATLLRTLEQANAGPTTYAEAARRLAAAAQHQSLKSGIARTALQHLGAAVQQETTASDRSTAKGEASRAVRLNSDDEDALAVVVPSFEGRGGHPVLLPRSRFEEVFALPSGVGLRALLSQRPERVIRIEVDDPAVRDDVDTPEDWARMRRRS